MQAVLTLYRSSIGKKATMAASGLLLFGFVLFHMAGNLQVFAGPEPYNTYAETLQGLGPLKWAARFGLLGLVIIHIVAAVQLTRMNMHARKVDYGRGRKNKQTTYAAITMRYGGMLLIFFIIYHLLHFTVGAVHPEFVPGDAYHNFISGFQNPIVIGFYVISMIALSMHLYHGVWSLLQTLGFNHPRYNAMRKQAAIGFAGLILLGNTAMPLAVFIGLIG